MKATQALYEYNYIRPVVASCDPPATYGLTRFSKWSVEYLVPVESVEGHSHVKLQFVIPFLLGNRNFGIFMKQADTYTKS